jgi:hypothetical protein
MDFHDSFARRVRPDGGVDVVRLVMAAQPEVRVGIYQGRFWGKSSADKALEFGARVVTSCFETLREALEI